MLAMLCIRLTVQHVYSSCLFNNMLLVFLALPLPMLPDQACNCCLVLCFLFAAPSSVVLLLLCHTQTCSWHISTTAAALLTLTLTLAAAAAAAAAGKERDCNRRSCNLQFDILAARSACRSLFLYLPLTPSPTLPLSLSTSLFLPLSLCLFLLLVLL